LPTPHTHRTRHQGRTLGCRSVSKGHMNTSRWLSTSLCLVSLLFLNPRSASAQIYEAIGTRAQGMGGAFVAVADDATATWWNPAGLILTYFSAVVEHSQLEEPTNPLPQDRVSRLKPNGFAVSFP